MYAPALLVAALGAVAVNANIADLGVPSTIKSGDTFNILGHQTIGQGYGEVSIIFGIQHAEGAIYPDALGDVFAGPYSLPAWNDVSFGSGGYNVTIPNVSLSYADGPAVVRAAVLGLAGVYKSMSLTTYSIDTTIGASTSTDYVYTDIFHRGASCTWQS
ncbi:hypothetical protein CONLIGDRAFT_665122 [Coniochaeta ligniaria NRRL 30616]|uniref:Secreted protein NIS1 n=1 Tax=Coniochaeta ligniaria NRRL 30616 TaxID=1408157 RepID=A0A1J7J2L6_9PEZI|nr:hypothetical protein CONLIGDRAFT_665122 [Coniochaeta ligniaria NRRL 30616]